jgi:hypothetical protein
MALQSLPKPGISPARSPTGTGGFSFGYGGSNYSAQPIQGITASSTSANVPVGYQYNDRPGVLGASTTGSGGGGVGATGTGQSQAGTDLLNQNINNQLNTGNEIIDRDYETAIAGLESQENTLRGSAGAAEQSIRASYAPARTAVQEVGATNLSKLGEEEATARGQEASGLRQARDLFRQTQQQNIAQLSGLGISSSSVAEALAERLGVETARRVAGVTGSANEIVQNIAQEKTRVETFTKQKLADLEQNLAAGIGQIQQGLIAGINQLNQARQVAAADKANRRAELLTNAQNAVNQLQAQAQQFSQALQQWNAQRSAALQESQSFLLNPTDFSGLQNWTDQVSQLPSVGGFNPVPTFESASGGYLKPGVSYKQGQDYEDIQF